MAKTILLADDSSTIRRIVELSFSRGDVRVVTVADGEAALEQFEQLRPDLVLADVVMPAPDGYELCRRIKSSQHPVPVVLLAGTFEPFDADRADACGADAHLVKPFESGQLRDKVQQLLDAPMDEAPAATDPVIHVAVTEDETSAVSESEEDRVSPELVDAVARAVIEKLGGEALREIAREVLPPLAARIIRERIRELEAEDS